MSAPEAATTPIVEKEPASITEPASSKPAPTKSASRLQYEQQLGYAEGVTRVSRKDTGNSKQRVAVLFGYVGTGYYGLQWDDNGLPTIENELEGAIYKMGAILDTNHKNLDKVKWTRSSRTDKGVHALGNVISLFMELPSATFDEDPLGLKVAEKINEHLPAAIRVFSVVKVSRKFNPRDQCAIRTYNIIWPRNYIDESEHNLEAIGKIMSQFHGHHNFHNFTRAQHCYKPVPGVVYSTPASSTSSSSTTSTSSSTTSTSTPTDSAASIADASTTSTAPTTPSEPTPSTTTPSTTTDAPSAATMDDDSEGEEEDDTGGEVKAKSAKPVRQQGKPRGFKAPPRREDQIATFAPHDSYVRRMIYLGPETPFTLGGEEWVPFKFVGESFAYNQIRKMLGYVLHISHKHVPVSSLELALNSPFKIPAPMTPGECLYLLGGTYQDRNHLVVDLFQFLPKDHDSISTKFDNDSKPLPWHQLLEESHTSTTPGAVILQKMKYFRDNVLHPHILQLYKNTNSYKEFVEGIKQDRFKIPDLEECQKLFVEWQKEQNERKEKKRQFFAERDGEQKKFRGNKNKNVKMSQQSCAQWCKECLLLEAGYIHTQPTDSSLSSSHYSASTCVFDSTFWQKLSPLHVEDADFVNSSNITSYPVLDSHKTNMKTDGFTEIKNIEWGNINVEEIASTIANLVRHGWPPIFAIVYDEVWMMAYKFIEMLRGTVHPDLCFNMDFWAWYIDPLKTDKGWGPHRDRYNMPFAPLYATVWVSLTESTLNNGCIFVVPASWDDNYHNSGEESSEFDCQDLRALPIKAGEALAWSGRLIHFGTRASNSAKVPRISIAFAASVSSFEDPSIRLGKIWPPPDAATGGSLQLPSLRDRLKVVAAQAYTYEERVPLSEGVERVLDAINRIFEEEAEKNAENNEKSESEKE